MSSRKIYISMTITGRKRRMKAISRQSWISNLAPQMLHKLPFSGYLWFSENLIPRKFRKLILIGEKAATKLFEGGKKRRRFRFDIFPLALLVAWDWSDSFFYSVFCVDACRAPAEPSLGLRFLSIIFRHKPFVKIRISHYANEAPVVRSNMWHNVR